MEFKLKVANDNGNSEQELLINGDLIRQPNVYAIATAKQWDDETNVESLISNLMNHLVVNIQSPAIVASGSLIYIGNQAINSKYEPHNMELTNEPKSTSDLPIINTLGNIAGYVVQKAFNKSKKLPTSLKVTVDMATALPVTQWNKETALKFANRFMKDLHNVMVYVGDQTVMVSIKFEYVKVIPEGTPVLFALIEDQKGNYRDDEIFTEFKSEYGIKKIDGEYFKEKRLLHVDIGDGTTEYPITSGYDFEKEFIYGTNNGVGYAAELAMENLVSDTPGLTKLTRQKFNEYLQNEGHKYHGPAKRFMEQALISQILSISKGVSRQLSNVQNEIDVIVCYGGGSIAMNEKLYPQIKKLADNIEAKVLWVPEQFAVTMNVEGLNIFLNTVLPQLKEKELSKN